MTTPREIAEKLYLELHGHMVTWRLEQDDISRITAALESYGRECREQALEEAAAVVFGWIKVDHSSGKMVTYSYSDAIHALKESE